jgi:3-oxoacyl-[acyl-carrier-protein] synthase-1
MRRVVVTGMGIVSSIGNSAQEVTAALREGRSGISFAEDYAQLGFRCTVHGQPTLDWKAAVPRKPRRFMEAGVGWNYIAMEQAIADSGLEKSDVSNERTGIIVGSGGPSTKAIVGAADTAREKDPKKGRPVRSAQRHEFRPLGRACHGLRDQGYELFDLLGVFYVGPLHRQCC